MMKSTLMLPPVFSRETLFKVYGVGLLLLWGGISLISWNHLERQYSWLNIPSVTLGWLGWGMAVLTILYLGRAYLKEVFLVFFTFCVVGFILGPYLEPPADPLEHLRRVYSYCGQLSYDLPRENRGLWHYSMSGVFLCQTNLPRTPESILHNIDFLYGVYIALLTTALFLLGKSAGLTGRWSFFAALTGFLFFGTNKFSFFSYYALAASCSSILIYWLWIAFFFFKQNVGSIFLGSLFALLAVPVIWVNHSQEAAFLGVVLGLWLLLNIHTWIWPRLNYQINISLFSFNYGKFLYIAVLLGVFFVLPQLASFEEWFDSKEWLSTLHYNWQANRTYYHFILDWIPYYPLGNFIGYRVGDTLGLMGFLPALLILPLLWPRLVPLSIFQRSGIIILSTLPLLVFVIPLFNLLWISNLRAAVAEHVYWRIAYSSLFWLALAAVLFAIDKKISSFLRPTQHLLKKAGFSSSVLSMDERLWLKWGQRAWFVICLVILLFLASIRSFPVFGKLDFITLDSRPWWPEWRHIIEQANVANKPIYTDRVTSLVLHDVFGYETMQNDAMRPMNINNGEIDITKMNYQGDGVCLINLKGFHSSWVPKETGHWNYNVSYTAQRYQHEGALGGEIEDLQSLEGINNCLVFK